MLDLDVDLNFVKMVEEDRVVWVAFSAAHRKNVSEDTKKAMLTAAIQRGVISMYVGNGRGRGVWSSYVHSSCIDEFFRDCHLFKERPRDMPKEFIIGRTYIGNPIKIVINGEFVDPMCG